MEHDVVVYIKKHTFAMTVLVVAGFFLLAMGEFYLYRQQMKLNQMISEGFMQVKELNNGEEYSVLEQ